VRKIAVLSWPNGVLLKPLHRPLCAKSGTSRKSVFERPIEALVRIGTQVAVESVEGGPACVLGRPRAHAREEVPEEAAQGGGRPEGNADAAGKKAAKEATAKKPSPSRIGSRPRSQARFSLLYAQLGVP
jgi:hypothetical protein